MLLILFAIFIFWMKVFAGSLVVYLLIFLSPSLIQFFATPIAKLVGLYKYLSPMLFAYAANDKLYEIHNGTSFDYLMVMTAANAGPKFKKQMLNYYLDGLLKIVEKIEGNELPESVVIRGSSYFFSDRTAKKLGFTLLEGSLATKINLFVNYLDLIWMYSLSRGRLSFPSLRNIKAGEITGQQLVLSKNKLLKMNSLVNNMSK